MPILSNKASWEYANQRANQRKGAFARAIRKGVVVIPHEVIKGIPFSSDKAVLHLMCNDGREAAYLARKFNLRITGVDFSAAAIQFARRLHADLKLDSKFIEADALAWLRKCPPNSFDIAITTLGTLWWIPNLLTYFQRIASVLRPHGNYCLWDFHPLVTCVDDRQKLYRPYPFRCTKLVHDSGILDYTADPEAFLLLSRKRRPTGVAYRNMSAVSDYRWSLAAIVNAALDAGDFRIQRLDEFDFLWTEKYFSWLTARHSRRFVAAPGVQPIPLAVRIVLQRK